MIVFIKERSVFLLGHSWTDLDRKMGLFWTILGKSLILKGNLRERGSWRFFCDYGVYCLEENVLGLREVLRKF